MKRYRVWMTNMYAVDIDAKTVEIVSLNDRPCKIKFLGEDNYVLAEFYCDMISGWAELPCIVDYTNQATGK